MAVTTCATCGHWATDPDPLWLRLQPLAPDTLAQAVGVTVCCPKCGVAFLEAQHRPTGIGVAL